MHSLSAFYANSCIVAETETNSGIVKLFAELEKREHMAEAGGVVQVTGLRSIKKPLEPIGTARLGPIAMNRIVRVAEDDPAAVVSFDFSSFYMGSRGIEALCQTLNSFRRLESVTFANMKLDPDAHEHIAKWASTQPKLRHLDIMGNPVYATGGRQYADMLKKNPRIVVFHLDYEEMPGRIATQVRTALGRNIAAAFPVDEKRYLPLEAKKKSPDDDGENDNNAELRRVLLMNLADNEVEASILRSIVDQEEKFMGFYHRYGMWVCQLVADFGVEVLDYLRHPDTGSQNFAVGVPLADDTVSGDGFAAAACAPVDWTTLLRHVLRPLDKSTFSEALTELLVSSSTEHDDADGRALPAESGLLLQEQLQHCVDLGEKIFSLNAQLSSSDDNTESTLEQLVVVIEEMASLLPHIKRRLAMCNPDVAYCPLLAESEAGSDAMETTMVEELYTTKRSLLLLRDRLRYLNRDFPATSKGHEIHLDEELASAENGTGASLARRRARKEAVSTAGLPAAEVRRRYALCGKPLREDFKSALAEVMISLRLDVKTASKSSNNTDQSPPYGLQRHELLSALVATVPARFTTFLVSLHLERSLTNRLAMRALEERPKDGSPLTKSLEALIRQSSHTGLPLEADEVPVEDPVLVIVGLTDARAVSQSCRQAAAWWRLRTLLKLS